eukprot:scaffold61586_cov25-Tisochrysis_lutea.AAC.2
MIEQYTIKNRFRSRRAVLLKLRPCMLHRHWQANSPSRDILHSPQIARGPRRQSHTLLSTLMCFAIHSRRGRRASMQLDA